MLTGIKILWDYLLFVRSSFSIGTNFRNFNFLPISNGVWKQIKFFTAAGSLGNGRGVEIGFGNLKVYLTMMMMMMTTGQKVVTAESNLSAPKMTTAQFHEREREKFFPVNSIMKLDRSYIRKFQIGQFIQAPMSDTFACNITMIHYNSFLLLSIMFEGRSKKSVGYPNWLDCLPKLLTSVKNDVWRQLSTSIGFSRIKFPSFINAHSPLSILLFMFCKKLVTKK